MPIAVSGVKDLNNYLREAMTVAALRFLKDDIKPGTKWTASGWHDAWSDRQIPGLFRLNCFFAVPPVFVKAVPWSPKVNLLLERRGANGRVLYNGGLVTRRWR